MDNVIIGGLLGIIATLLAGWFAIYIPRRNARREAGRQLIAEFAIVETSFNKIAKTNPLAIEPVLREAYRGLEEKITIFKRHLFYPWEKRGFNKAWINYYNHNGDARCQSYLNYMPFNEQPPYIETPQYIKNFNHNVDNLLKYAKPK